MPALNLSPFFFLALFLLISTARSEALGGFDDDARSEALGGFDGFDGDARSEVLGGFDDDACAAQLSDGNASASACPINCFRADPVCGVDGVTYWCGCPDAACAGVRVAKRGPCQVGNGGSGLVSGQALLLVHIVWLIVLGFAVLFGFL